MTVYNTGMAVQWRIDGLSEMVGNALNTAAYDGQESGRVRDVPDVRTIRYYTTLGLLDRPAQMQGRTAFYGQRHVMQLVAIKRLQAKNLSLVEVQQTLAGIGDKELERLAELPDGLFEQATGETSSRKGGDAKVEKPTAIAARKFWEQSPELPENEPEAATAVLEPRPAVVVPLAEGISLTLEGAGLERIEEADFSQLGPAVAMLQEALIRIGVATAPQHQAAQPRKEEPT